MSKITIRCDLENIVNNLDATMSVYFRLRKAEQPNLEQVVEELRTTQQGANLGLKIEIDKYRERRSLNANSYFHTLVDKLAKALNKGADETKRDLVLDYGSPAKRENGEEIFIKLPKDVNVETFYPYAKWIGDKKEKNCETSYYMLYKHTHTLDSKEMAKLIDGTVEECKGQNIETRTKTEISEMISLWEKER